MKTKAIIIEEHNEDGVKWTVSLNGHDPKETECFDVENWEVAKDICNIINNTN